MRCYHSFLQGGIGCLRGPVPGYNSSVCGGCGHYASAVMMTLLLQNTPQLADKAARWEKEVFIPLAANLSSAYPGLLRVTYMAERSVSDQIAIVDEQNGWIVAVSYAAMFLYIILALGRFPHPVATRSLLGLNGIIIVALSVATSIGILSAGGMHITMIVTEVVPFLILALGVDNMFILTKAFDTQWGAARRRQRRRLAASSGTSGADDDDDVIASSLGEALAEVGPTITAAAVSEMLAFAVGVTTGIPALVQFCAVAALAVAVDFVLQLTWFAAAVVLDARRQAAGRLDLLPCIRLKNTHSWYKYAPEEEPAVVTTSSAHDSTDTAQGRGGGAKGVAPLLSDQHLEGHAHSYADASAALGTEGNGSGDDEAAHDGSLSGRFWGCVLRGGYVRRFMTRWYAPFLLSTPVRVVVLAAYCAALGTAIYGVTQLQMGLEQQLAMPTGSYLKDYFDDQGG